MLNIRTNILFDDSMWSQLTSLAKAQNTSVGQLVRSAVQTVYLEKNRLQARALAFDKIIKIRPKLQKINYRDLIDYGRER